MKTVFSFAFDCVRSLWKNHKGKLKVIGVIIIMIDLYVAAIANNTDLTPFGVLISLLVMEICSILSLFIFLLIMSPLMNISIKPEENYLNNKNYCNRHPHPDAYMKSKYFLYDDDIDQP